jgi:glycosyltransferase involved in cell wall biosynthesis
MDQKLLSICVPTYNRSTLLENQLEWLSQALIGLESFCEVIISDNASRDNTWEVIERSKLKLERVKLRVNRNQENIGAVGNIVHCINLATARFVWVISDDDEIFESTIANVLEILKQSPNLGYLFLNYVVKRTPDSSPKPYPIYDLQDEEEAFGKVLFEKVMKIPGARGLIFTTACIYRTDLAQNAIKSWKAGVKSSMFQLYISAYCALHGPMHTTKEPHLIYVGARGWLNSLAKRDYLNFALIDYPEIFVKLMQMGYSASACKPYIYRRLSRRQERRVLAKSFLKSPFLTGRYFIQYLTLLWRVRTEF